MENVIEVSGDKLCVWALSKDGIWLKLVEVEINQSIWKTFRVPLLVKIEE